MGDHEELGTNRSYTWSLKVEGSDGQIDAAFADAAHTVKERYVQQRLIPMALETRAAVAVPQPFGGDVTLYSTTQIPAHPQDHVGDHARPRRASGTRRRPGRRRCLRVEAQRLRRLKALKLDPNSSSTYNLLISTYLAANRLPQAIAVLEGLLSRSPDNARVLMVLAMTCERINDFPKARDAYEKLLAVKPDSPYALNNLAYLYAERLDQPDKAYDLAQKARGLQPADAGIADTLGWILYKKGNYQQSLTLLQESAQKLPNNPEIQFHLAMASYMMGDMDAARTAFRQAAAAANDFPGKEEVRRRLALLEGVEGKATELSSDNLEAILEQQPDDVVTRMLLGEFYRKAGSIRQSSCDVRTSDQAESQAALGHGKAGSAECRPFAGRR